ncbi:MAG: response regulator [Thermosynechococcaceae cyanobacterium]
MTTRRILIIDDEEPIREVVQICLTKLGHWETILASSGAEGLLKAEAEHPDAILLDMSMPGMDGTATFRKLQGNPSTQSIPVIFLTAKVQPAEQSQYVDLGVAGLIMKPFDPVHISQQVARILGWE